jgi:hypothetical protein
MPAPVPHNHVRMRTTRGRRHACEDAEPMPRLTRLFPHRWGAFGIALTAWDIWRRLPPHYRRQIIAATRKHGPRVASAAVKRYGEYRRARR